jgi:branched-chain amino acid aminotransferase
MNESEAHLPLLTHAFHYGTGVFEGIRAYHDRESGRTSLFRAEDHFKRMARNTKILKMTLPAHPAALVAIAADLIRRNGFVSDVYVRPLAYKNATRVGVSLPEGDGFLMIAVPMGDYIDTRKGLHCGVSSWRRLPDNAIPCHAKICGAYVNSALAAQEARDRGFDEAIFLNETGHVAEGSAMNLFIVRDGHLVTPDVSQGILEGITRDTVMTVASEQSIARTEERPVDRTELYVADEVFLCGTAAEIAPVTRIDGRVVGEGQPGKITLSLQRAYDLVVRGGASCRPGWIEPVYRHAVAPNAG